MKFGFIFFSGDERNKYRLVMETAKFGDENGFSSIWTPERHFHRFGGLYPNPSVVSAALAMVTKRLQICAGSVVVPTHNVVRVAEEWSVVDNLSGGRAGLALATGFSPIDFSFMPQNWDNRRNITFEAVETIRRLWEGEAIDVRDGVGNISSIELHPRPIQQELPMWLTCTKSVDTFERAGRLGCNVLTGLIDMSTEELEKKLKVYEQALEENGHDRRNFQVTLLLHTYIGEDDAEVRATVHDPFTRYLRSFFKVVDSQKKALTPGESIEDFSNQDQEALISFAFDKFYSKGSLMGTPDSCSWVVERMAGIGVDEIACLIDFGVDEDKVLKSLHQLKKLKDRYSD
ncbi:MupA/Atu3671 family FMN-dependent luciferase-like monooxygenase [Halothiobacillus sp.]|uniref:MupA/Atu3671 family FMN-dependent luciferase-like monooxygenase n=1 Tax=Halothiobacillus sp. TaxID=1891311 RepID=UPI00262A71EE|nr:MupA/Atu3671 family FMN-dependent luciferase-like monooxygenase [Halothiobacillus sp.]MDD4965743.1 LLM class flavin-dependent oxidoreductase [Halothiobacillus sp.]